jgi:hypothetical protein
LLRESRSWRYSRRKILRPDEFSGLGAVTLNKLDVYITNCDDLFGGKTVIEIAEMEKRSRAEESQIKAMLSRPFDRGRKAYDRGVTERKRGINFIGTANDDKPLRDVTGNRRYLPVRCSKPIDIEWMRANIEQIYAEACVLEANGDDDFQFPPHLWAVAAEHQESARHKEGDEIGLEYLLAETEETKTVYITANDLATLATLCRWPGGSNKSHSETMQRLGFTGDVTLRIDGRRVKAWVRGDEGAVYDGQKLIGYRAARFIVGANQHTGLGYVTILPGWTPPRPGGPPMPPSA